ncbi:RNA polymerase sporulation sigma factor SigH [uncultured Eubacterium sp.]|uniref:RNA polymerase sporulation sigma factor SigH n=1 Tax=uncultured Eubacterium sp. TaxID=165185 RepID=UPI0025D792D4|nr:RNA polymerase sporulation sigma factor SigH [uncultured Eubacterium sp.]MCI6537302.1 RNA polymerase sporulation sigma factor SigH [Lachnospiraceae bacterium]
MKRQYDTFTDEELIEQLRKGDSAVMDFLMEKYKYLVRKKANAVFLLGGDTDDLVQEGMIGLFKAVRDFDAGKSSFFHFADLCIGRQIYHAIEAAGRKKHVPLNAYVSLSGQDADSETVALEDSLNSPQDNPEQMLIDQENVDAFLRDIHAALSPMENKVLEAYLDGWNYRQIAQKMGKTEKSIDNALQRIKAKILKLRCHK